MKKQSITPEKGRRKTCGNRWRDLRKRLLVMGLTVSMVANTVDLTSLAVSAKTEESRLTIVSFETLSKDITEQTLPVGALESDIILPASLTVTVEKTMPTETDDTKKENQDQNDQDEKDQEKEDTDKEDQDKDPASETDPENPSAGKDGDEGEDPNGENGGGENGSDGQDEEEPRKPEDQEDAQGSQKPEGQENAQGSQKPEGKENAQDSREPGDLEDAEKAGSPAEEKGGAASGNENGSDSTDTEDTQAHAGFSSAFDTLLTQLADTFLPQPLVVYAAEKEGTVEALAEDTEEEGEQGAEAEEAAETGKTTTEKLCLENIKWELDADESDGAEFDSSEASNGFCYTYTPVLSETDSDGNQLVLGKDAVLPTIYVLIGEYGIATLTGEETISVEETDASGITTTNKYADLATWIEAKTGANLEKAVITLLKNDASITEERACVTKKANTGVAIIPDTIAQNVELDLAGHTLDLNTVGLKRTGGENTLTTIMSSAEGGKITSSNGLRTIWGADSGTLTIEQNVTVENTGSGNAVTLNGGGKIQIGDGVTLHAELKQALAATEGEAIITGGTFEGTVLIGKEGAASSAKISGGTFIPNVGNGVCSIAIDNGNKLDTVIDKNCKLQKTDGTCIEEDLSNLTEIKEQVEVVSASLFFTKQPVIEESQSTILRGHELGDNLGNKLVLSVEVAGTAVSSEADVTYQWYWEKTLDGQTEATKEELEKSNTCTTYVQYLKAGIYKYYCVAKCGSDEAVSRSVTFTVKKGAVSMHIGSNLTKHYETLGEALDEINAGVQGDIINILQDIDNENFNNKQINVGVAGLVIDLNGHNVGYKENGTWKTDMTGFGIILNGGDVYLQNSSETENGYLHGTLQVENGGCHIRKGVTYENLNLYKNGSKARAYLLGGTCKGTISIGKGEDPYTDDNGLVECTIKEGTYNEVEVCYDAKLYVNTGDVVEINKLTAKHARVGTGTSSRDIKRAVIWLQNGHYGTIAVELLGSASEEDLENKYYKLAIQDMLQGSYVFGDSEGEEITIPRTTTEATDLTVRRPEITEGNATVRIEAEKTDGTVETTYHASWKAATNYLSDGSSAKDQFDTWKSIRIVLLRDARIISTVETWSDCFAHSLPSITVCSENGIHTLTGSGNNLVLGGPYLDVTLKDIKIAYGCMEGTAGATFTLEEGVEVSAAPDPGKAAMEVTDGELVLNDASVISTTEGSYAVDLCNTTLRMNGQETKLTSAYIDGDSNKRVTAVIDALSAAIGVIPAFTANDENAELDIYFTGVAEEFDNALAGYTGNVKVWYQINLGNGAALAEGKNADTVTNFEEKIYGLYRKNNEKDSFTIYVEGNACRYTTYQPNAGGTRTFRGNNHFVMRASSVAVEGHKWQTDGSCSNSDCGTVDIERAYAAGKLQIEGLEGRTYDSYPQTLTRITWTSQEGTTQELIAPIYQDNRWSEGHRKPLGVGGEPLNDNAEYAVLYQNNVAPYSYSKGEEGFDAAKAPQVTITGRKGRNNNYVGSLTLYFTIGKGEMRLGDFEVCGTEGDISYDGKEHPAWNKTAVEFKTDPWDGKQFTEYADAEYIQACDRTMADSWFGTLEDSWENPLKVEYSTDNKVSWATAREFGRAGDSETPYMITDAGEHPFYIRVTEKNCGTLVSEKLVAKITPKDLNGSDIVFDASADVTAYYTGKPVIPTDFDDKITDSTLNRVLMRDKDFTVSAENNTDVSNDATIVFTGTGNYKGQRTADFAIKYAFALAQTSISKDEGQWYHDDDPRCWKDGGVPVCFRVSNSTVSNGLNYPQWIVYRSGNEAGLSDKQKVEFYTSLEAAVAGTNPGYTFRGEGTQTVTLWGKDTDTGYIAAPVEVTLKIDNTAPTWADKDGNEEGYGIQIKDNWWRKFLNTVSFGLFYRDSTLDIIIKANDEKNGVDQVSGRLVYYCYIQKLSEEEIASGEVKVKTAEELEPLTSGAPDIYSGFVAVSGGAFGIGKVTGKLAEDGSYIVYAYAVDNYGKGKRSDYICSEGIVIDSAVPELKIEAPDKENGTLKDTEATIRVKGAKEDMTLLWFSVHEEEFENTEAYKAFVEAVKNYVTTNRNNESSYPREAYLPLAIYEDGKYRPSFSTEGEEVLVTKKDGETRAMHSMEITKGDSELKITGLQPAGQCTVWMAAIDRAGNIVQTSVEFTTTKAMPTIETLPEVSGVYGDTAGDLQIAKKGKAVYGGTEIKGEWKVTDTGSTRLQAGETVQCKVTFTPDAAAYGEQFENVVMFVPVTVAKRPITIQVENMKKTYGEPFLGIDGLTFEIVDMAAVLAGGDTKDTIKDTLKLTIAEAATESTGIAGEWAFTVTSDSPNYEVTVEYYVSLSDTSRTKSFGTLIIEKAAGEILTTAEFKKEQDVQYQYDGDFAAFTLGVHGNHNEKALQYKVTDAKKADGRTIADSEIEKKLLSISESGTVTLKGAGSAKITIMLPESNNYQEAAAVEVQVKIAKADLTIPEFTKSVIYARENALTYNMITVNSLNTGRLGAVTYGNGNGNAEAIDGMTVTVNGSTVDYDGAKQEFFAMLPYISNAAGGAEIACTVKSLSAYEPKTAVVTIPAVTENCTINGGKGLTFRLEIVDKKTVEPKTAVKAKGTLTYGEALSKLSFEKAVFYDTTDENITVPGTLEWKEPELVPDAGTYQAEYVFTPYSAADPLVGLTYVPYTGTVTVTVNKAKAKLVSAPVPGERVCNPNLGLYEELLNSDAKTRGVVEDGKGNQIGGEWKFVDETVIRTTMKVGSRSYEIYFVPSSIMGPEGGKIENYDFTEVKATVTITVKKAIPYIKVQPSVANAYTHGDYLYNQKLTGEAICGDGMGGEGVSSETQSSVAGTFTWKTPSTKLSYKENQGKTYDYIFTPEDGATFETVTGSIAVTVNQAQNPPLMPGSKMNVASTCEKVGDVKLPNGWAWEEAELEKALTIGGTVSVKADYTGADADNYVNTSVTIEITRADCEHKHTEVKGAVKATCAAEGRTGETWCKDCQQKLDDGFITAKDASNHTALTETVLKKATTSSEGLVLKECSLCGYSQKVKTAKLPGGGSSAPSGNEDQQGEPENTQDQGTQGTGGGQTESGSSQPGNETKQGQKPGDGEKKQDPAKDQNGNPSGDTKPAGNKNEAKPGTGDGNGNTAKDSKEKEPGKPFIKGEDGKEGWQVIESWTDGAKEGDTVHVDMNGSTTVPGEIFDSIRGRDVTVTFDMGNGISWTVNGLDITAQKGETIDFGVYLGAEAGKSIPVAVINNVTGERYSMNLTLSHEGEFGFTAVLTVNMDAANAGLYANLFYYNPESGALEFICAGQIDAEGNTDLTFTHASDYTIVIDTEPMDGQKKAGEETGAEAVKDAAEEAADADGAEAAPAENAEAKDVGSHAAVIWLIALAGIAAVAVIGTVLVKKRKKENEQE